MIQSDNLPPSLQRVKRLVTLGDSITQGGGQPGGYVWLMERALQALFPEQSIEIINAGISGHKATDMQARFRTDVLDRRPDLVTISVGVNDVWHAFQDFNTGQHHPNGDLPAGVPLELYRQKLEEMIAAAQNMGVRVVLLSPTVIHENPDSPENIRLAGYIAAMKELAASYGCLFIDLNAAFREVIATFQKHAGCGMNLLTTDGVHLNAAGNWLMAFTILRGLGVDEKELRDLPRGWESASSF